jgi:glutamine amidotransferase
MRVALIDTGYANLRSVQRALEEAGRGLNVRVERTHAAERIAAADKLVVPGQGGFGDCVTALGASGARQALLERLRAGTHYLGICLGLQALFDGSDEAHSEAGLGVLKGQCVRLEPAPGVKIPHMGWNSLEYASGGHPVLDAAGGEGAWYYFVHSYHAVPADPSVIRATVQHGPHRVTAAVAKDNLLATQFHPEKSQRAGLRLLEAFLRW